MDLIQLAKEGLIIEDEKNRVNCFGGSKQVSSSHVNKIADNLFLPALGMAVAEVQGNGVAVQKDFHHRLRALIKALDELNKASLIEGNGILLRLVKQGLGGKTNAKLNDQNGHSSRVKLFNDSLEFGHTMNQVYEALEVEVPGKFGPAIANALYALSNGKENLSAKQIYQLRGAVSKIVDEPRRTKILPGFDNKVKARLVAGVEAAMLVINQLKETWEANRQMNDILPEILTSVPFFGVLLADAISDSKKILSKHDPELENNLAYLIQRSAQSFLVALKRLYFDDEYNTNETIILAVMGIGNRTKANKNSPAVRMYLDRYTNVENQQQYFEDLVD